MMGFVLEMLKLGLIMI